MINELAMVIGLDNALMILYGFSTQALYCTITND